LSLVNNEKFILRRVQSEKIVQLKSRKKSVEGHSGSGQYLSKSYKDALRRKASYHLHKNDGLDNHISFLR